MSTNQEKQKSIKEMYEAEIKQEPMQIVKIMEETVGISEQMSRTLGKAVQDTGALATQVLDYLGIRGQERKIAEGVVGKGDKEAERTSIFLVARQIKQEEKWRWITLGMSFASLVLAIIALVVSLAR